MQERMMNRLSIKTKVAGVILGAALVWGFSSHQHVRAAADTGRTHSRTPVLVELFTSEGCSSCPPADELLARLSRTSIIPDAEIITLGEHVDYWDGIGWRDRFSSHQFTERQNTYAQRFHLGSDYTPQMVVDGAAQFVGNDAASAEQAIRHATRQPKLALRIQNLSVQQDQASADISLDPLDGADNTGTLLNADLFAALTDKVDTTDVRAGENGGRRLTHVNVMRTLQRVGSLGDLQAKPLHVQLTLPQGTVPANLRLVVFAQERGQGRVLAAAMQ